MNHASLATVAQNHGNSFYLFYPEVFKKNINDISAAFRSVYESTIVAYALKANYMPALARIIGGSEHWCEVVSAMEYDIASDYIPAERLIFNGPCKSKEVIRRAVNAGVVVNLDSFHELDLLIAILDEFESVSVGLRVSFDIGTAPSRFGFEFENGEFTRAIDRLLNTGRVRVSSLHSHYTTRERSLPLFEKRVSGMLKVYESLKQKDDLEYLNVGGGFFGPMQEDLKRNQNIDPPEFEEYAEVIAGGMREYFGKDGPSLVIEPGVSMVADCMDYVVRILDCRKTRSRDLLTVDGSVNNLYPTGSRYRPSYNVVAQSKSPSRTCDVAGNTCMEHDILLSECLLSAQPGDFIVFRNRGAYSNVYTPPFIHPAPPILGMDGEVFSARQTCREVLSSYVQ